MTTIPVNRQERVFHNRNLRNDIDITPPSREPQEFHRKLPGYVPTPLRTAPATAVRLGLERLWIKDESMRMGLPAFKILGASWAVYRSLRKLLPEAFTWNDIDDLKRGVAPLRPLTLTCATDGNHGRAVARMARTLGLKAHIFVPEDMSEARKTAIAEEGARVTVVEGSYDDAVALSAIQPDERTLIISDTSWPGYEDVPRWVIEGYSTILWEVEDELARLGETGPDLVVVQMGVGAFASAVVRHFRRPHVVQAPTIFGVEPTRAACLLASMEAGKLVQIPGPLDSIMSGLNCGLPSEIAWPSVSNGIDVFIAIDDERTRDAMRALAAEGIVAGECGAAGLAGLITWSQTFGGDVSGKRALVISTEGATDRTAYDEIVKSL